MQKTAAATLQNQIRSISRRMKVILTVDAVAWTIVLLVISCILLSWLDIIWQLPWSVRRAAIPVALVASLVLLIALVIRRWRTTHADTIARRMDDVSGSGGQILSGWDLMGRSGDRNPLADGIAAVAVDQASHRAAAVDARVAAPWRTTRQSLIATVAVALIVGFFATFASHAFATSWKRLFSPSIDTPPYSPLVFDVLPGNAEVTYGSPVEITATISGGAVDHAALVLGDPDDVTTPRVSLFPRGGGVWQAVLPRMTEPTAYCISALRGRSEAFQIDVIETPQIESVHFTVTPPAYTRLPPTKGRHPQDRIAGLQQTSIELEVTGNRPLSSGSVRMESTGNPTDAPEIIALEISPDDPQRCVGSVILKRGGRWTISISGRNGFETQSPVKLETELLIDQPPICRIIQPREFAYATTDSQIPIVLSGEDDFGIARLRLYRILNGSRPSPLELPVSDAVRTVQGESLLPLEKYGLRPGDKISLFGRADDTRPLVVQGGESPIAEIEIISQQDFTRMIAARQGQQMLENKFKQARRMMDRLATDLTQLQEVIAKSDLDDANQQKKLQERLDDLQSKMNEVAQGLEDLAKQELPLEMDKAWSQLLRDHAAQLRAAAAQCIAMKKDGKTPKEQADELHKRLGAIRGQQEQQINQPLDALRKIAPLIASESGFVQLVARQRAVVDALERFRKSKAVRDEADRQSIVRLRDEEAAIRESLDELMTLIQTQAEKLGDDPDFQDLKNSSVEFVNAVRESSIDDELAAANRSLGEFDAAESYASALKALQQMEKFLSQCESNSQSASQCLKKKFAPGMPKSGSGDPLSQMLSQMGINSGPGGGYSMRGNSGNNVGLYGNQPFAQPAGGGQGSDGRMSPASGERNVLSRDADSIDSAEFDLPQTNRGGVREVPLRYRRQAEIYLRRLAEQTE